MGVLHYVYLLAALFGALTYWLFLASQSSGRIYNPRPSYPPFRLPPLDSHHEEAAEEHSLWLSHAQSVKQSFQHAYGGYQKFAPFPADELRPLSNESATTFNGWAVTMVDSLDTMLLLGLRDEFEHAIADVARINFVLHRSQHAAFFETTIRYLGGFLSAYALSKEPILLSRADELGGKLLPAFNTLSGLPVWGVNPQTGELTDSETMLFAEVASCQLEYKYLAYLTGREIYFTTVEKVVKLMEASQTGHGMWSTLWNVSTGRPAENWSHTSVGAWADSSFEYLLKQYLMTNKTDKIAATMYVKAMNGVLENLLFLSPTRSLLYVTDAYALKPTRKFEHLSCFFPGLLMLGVATLLDDTISPRERERHEWAAEGLAHTCWIMYADQASGLGPEIVKFDRGNSESDMHNKWITHLERWEWEGRQGGKPPFIQNAGQPISGDERSDYKIESAGYFLRPETLESMFVMWRTTRDMKWRQRGWQIWDAIESKTRTPSGYANVRAVNEDPLVLQDSMQSYFLAETVKYAYLLAIDTDPWPVTEYVLNTEAHPLPVFDWREWERQRYDQGNSDD